MAPRRAISALEPSVAQRARLLEQLERRPPGCIQTDRRGENRLKLRVPCITVALKDERGGAYVFAASPRNLTSRGLAFLHHERLGIGLPCKVTLPMLGGRWDVLQGSIVACRAVEGQVFEAVAVFDVAIEVSHFLNSE